MICMLYHINVTKCLSDANHNQSPNQRVANEVLNNKGTPCDGYTRYPWYYATVLDTYDAKRHLCRNYVLVSQWIKKLHWYQIYMTFLLLSGVWTVSLPGQIANPAVGQRWTRWICKSYAGLSSLSTWHHAACNHPNQPPPPNHSTTLP